MRSSVPLPGLLCPLVLAVCLVGPPAQAQQDDTTIRSSLASGCDHIDHTRTQLPYARAVGAVAVVVGTLPAGYGVP